MITTKVKKTSTPSITFPVDKVEIGSKLLSAKPYQEVVAAIVRRQSIREAKNLPPKERILLEREPSRQYPDLHLKKLEATAKDKHPLIATDFHAFVETLHKAYAYHYPLTISPDMIWLLIVQGFANHVNEHSEAMRSHFVEFEGQKTLTVIRNQFRKGNPNNDWQGVFESFSKQIAENTGEELVNLVTGDFSTTGMVEKAAFQVTLMDAMKSYFIFSVSSSCGIPEITLEGSPADWESIEAKAASLAQYDLQWWTSELLPILKEFTKASRGEYNQEFWQSIYKWNGARGSGSPYITGWILNFFPYMKDANGKLWKFIGEPSKGPRERGAHLVANTSYFPSGLSQADFIWNCHTQSYKMEFAAGFIGCKQDPKTLSLRPEISWAIIDTQEAPTDEELENSWAEGNQEYREWKSLQESESSEAVTNSQELVPNVEMEHRQEEGNQKSLFSKWWDQLKLTIFSA